MPELIKFQGTRACNKLATRQTSRNPTAPVARKNHCIMEKTGIRKGSYPMMQVLGLKGWQEDIMILSSVGNIDQDMCSITTKLLRLTQTPSRCVNRWPIAPDARTCLYSYQHSVSINQIMGALRTGSNHTTKRCLHLSVVALKPSRSMRGLHKGKETDNVARTPLYSHPHSVSVQ